MPKSLQNEVETASEISLRFQPEKILKIIENFSCSVRLLQNIIAGILREQFPFERLASFDLPVMFKRRTF